jgi:hypothetical protein
MGNAALIISLTTRTNGEENGQLTIGFLTQLATFFSQPRYQNLVTMVRLYILPIG